MRPQSISGTDVASADTRSEEGGYGALPALSEVREVRSENCLGFSHAVSGTERAVCGATGVGARGRGSQCQERAV
eukprot:2575003-Rhodomonas_salina.3